MAEKLKPSEVDVPIGVTVICEAVATTGLPLNICEEKSNLKNVSWILQPPLRSELI